MNYITDSTYSTTVVDSIRGLYERIIFYLPNVIIAIIILIVGWAIGTALGSAVKRILHMIKIDSLADQLGLQKLGAQVGKTLSVASFGKWLVKWFFFLASFIAATDVLGLTEVNQFLYDQVLPYAGHVIVAMAILLLGILAANFFGNIVHAAVKASGVAANAVLASLTRWAIVIFAVIAALSQLQLATAFLQELFLAVVAMLAIAGGIAFGLGGKEHARRVLDAVESGISKKM